MADPAEMFANVNMETPTTSGSSLHHSQKVFWYVTSFSVLALTIGFLFAMLSGRASSVKTAMFELTLREANESLKSSADSLTKLRNSIIEARNDDDDDAFQAAVDEFDKSLKALGVTQKALDSQRLLLRGMYPPAPNYPGFSPLPTFGDASTGSPYAGPDDPVGSPPPGLQTF